MPIVANANNFPSKEIFRDLHKKLVIDPFNLSHSASNEFTIHKAFFNTQIEPRYRNIFNSRPGDTYRDKVIGILQEIRGEILDYILLAIDDPSNDLFTGISEHNKQLIKNIISLPGNKTKLKNMAYNCPVCLEFRNLINTILNANASLNSNCRLGSWRFLDLQNDRRGYSHRQAFLNYGPHQPFGFFNGQQIIGVLCLGSTPYNPTILNGDYDTPYILAIYYLASKYHVPTTVVANSGQQPVVLSAEEHTNRFCGHYMLAMTEALRGYNEGTELNSNEDKHSCNAGVGSRIITHSLFDDTMLYQSPQNFVKMVVEDVVKKQVREILSRNDITIEKIKAIQTSLLPAYSSLFDQEVRDQERRNPSNYASLLQQRYSIFQNNQEFFTLILEEMDRVIATKQPNAPKEMTETRDALLYGSKSEADRRVTKLPSTAYREFIDNFINQGLSSFNRRVYGFSCNLVAPATNLVGYAFSDPAFTCYEAINNFCMRKSSELQPVRRPSPVSDEFAKDISTSFRSALKNNGITIVTNIIESISYLVASYKSNRYEQESDPEFIDRIKGNNYKDYDFELNEEEDVDGLATIIPNVPNKAMLIEQLANEILKKIKLVLNLRGSEHPKITALINNGRISRLATVGMGDNSIHKEAGIDQTLGIYTVISEIDLSRKSRMDATPLTDEELREKLNAIEFNLKALIRLDRLVDAYYDDRTRKYYIIQKRLGPNNLDGRGDFQGLADALDVPNQQGGNSRFSLELTQKLEVAVKIIAELRLIHAAGIYHGDLHPHNILYPAGNIIDFDNSVINYNGIANTYGTVRNVQHLPAECRPPICQNQHDYITNAKESMDVFSLGKLFSSNEMHMGLHLDNPAEVAIFSGVPGNYPDHMSNREKDLIARFIHTFMCADNPLHRPTLEQVEKFFVALKNRTSNSSAPQITIPEAVENLLSHIEEVEEIEPLADIDASDDELIPPQAQPQVHNPVGTFPLGYDEDREINVVVPAFRQALTSNLLPNVVRVPTGPSFRNRVVLGARATNYNGPYSEQHIDFPNIPCVTPYIPNGEDNPIYDAGNPSFPIAVTFPGAILSALPEGVIELLIRERIDFNNVSVSFCAQNMPSSQNDLLLLRAHPFVHQNAPARNYDSDVNISAGVFDLNARVDQLAQVQVWTHSAAEDLQVLFSPANTTIPGINRQVSHSFYSVCIIPAIGGNPAKAAITLHWLLNQADYQQIVSCINTNVDNRVPFTLEDISRWPQSWNNGTLLNVSVGGITAGDALRNLCTFGGGDAAVDPNANHYRLQEQVALGFGIGCQATQRATEEAQRIADEEEARGQAEARRQQEIAAEQERQRLAAQAQQRAAEARRQAEQQRIADEAARRQAEARRQQEIAAEQERQRLAAQAQQRAAEEARRQAAQRAADEARRQAGLQHNSNNGTSAAAPILTARQVYDAEVARIRSEQPNARIAQVLISRLGEPPRI